MVPSVNQLILFLLFILFIYGWYNQKYWKKRGIPFLKPVPLIGNIWPILTLKQSLSLFIADIYTQMDEPYFGIFMFGTPVLVIKSPDLVKSILIKDFDHFCDRTLFTDHKIDVLCAQFIFMEKNPSWKSSRKPLTQIFSSSKIKNMLPYFLQCSNEMARHVATMAAKKLSVEIKEVASNFMTALVACTIFGIDVNCFDAQESEFRANSREMFHPDLNNCFRQLSYFLFHGFVKFLRLSFIKPKVRVFFTDVFTRTIDQRVRSQVDRPDLVQLLIRLNKDMQENGQDGNTKILAHAIQLFLAGSETSSSTIGFLFYELCLNKNIQDKLRAEILENIKQHGGVTYESLPEMAYLHQCILETLRKYPVLPFLDRRCVRDYPIPDGSGHVIERGTAIYIPMFGFNYDRKYFSEPDRFDPERFNGDSEKQRHQFCFLPFGQGPRNCFGERYGLFAVKVCIVRILTNFEVRRNKYTPVPIEFSKVSFVLQSDKGLPMDFFLLE